jgi:AsmA protein
MTPLRWVFVAVFVLLLLPVLVIGVMIWRFDPNQYAPAIIAAVDQATGRQLTLGGPITIQFSLHPEISASDISLSNPAGFADPDLVQIGRVEAKIALLPLWSHQLDILQLVLVNPVIIFESGPDGRADWDVSPAPSGAAGPSAPAAPVQAGGRYKIALQAVEVQNGLLTLKGLRPGAPLTIAIPSLTGTADSLASPLHLTASATLGATPFTLSGVLGPIERFSGIGAGPWPLDLTAQLGGATASVLGAVDHPRTAQGYDLSVNITVPALETLTGALPAGVLGGLSLPPIHGISASARIVDQSSTIPAIDDLSIKAGASDLSALRPGLELAALDIEMASLDQPLSIKASGKIGDSPIMLDGNIGPPQALLNPALLPSTMPLQGSFPVAISAGVGAARFGVNGAIASPETLAGAALAVNASIPDLSLLGALVNAKLPSWKNITAQTTLIDPGGLGLRNAAGLDGLTVTLDNAAYGGDASLYFGAQPRLQMALKFSSVNIDALAAAMPAPASAPPALAAGANNLPDLQLPIQALKSASADIQLSADTVIWNQARYTALQGHAVLANGVLTLDPVTGQLPGGGLSASATLDSTVKPAAETLKISAPALALSPFLNAFGLPDTAQGTVQAQLAASATGDGLRAIAASLDGQLGLAMVNGVVDGSVMDRLFGSVLQTVGLPEHLVGAQGPVAVRCMALRVDATNGVGTIRALTLDSSRLLLQGGGSVNFGDQTLGIVLRPQLQFIGTQVGVPVEVGGTFEAPTTRVAPLSALKSAAQSAIGLPVDLAQRVLGTNNVLAQAANAIGIGGSSGDVCPAALALGRLGQPGPAAPPPAAPAGGIGSAVLSGPKNLLNTLLGK